MFLSFMNYFANVFPSQFSPYSEVSMLLFIPFNMGDFSICAYKCKWKMEMENGSILGLAKNGIFRYNKYL